MRCRKEVSRDSGTPPNYFRLKLNSKISNHSAIVKPLMNETDKKLLEQIARTISIKILRPSKNGSTDKYLYSKKEK
jgi:hypothetical protein